MPFCQNCGKEASVEAVFCERCGERIPDLRVEGVGVEWTPPRKGLANHLEAALGLIRAKPILLVPEVVGGFISMILTLIWGVVGQPLRVQDLMEDYLNSGWGVITVTTTYPDALPEFWGAIFQYMSRAFLFLIIIDIISKFFTFATIDLARKAYRDDEFSLWKTAGYVRSRLGVFMIASIVGQILQLTLILLPLSILFFMVLVVEDTGITTAISKGFRLGTENFGTVTGLIILWIVSYSMFSLIPFVSAIARAIPNGVLYVALVDLYNQSER